MAIGFVSTRMNAAIASVGTSWAPLFSNPQLVAEGNHLILAIAVDNSGTNGVAPTIGVVDLRAQAIPNGFNGNRWRKMTTATMDPGAANEGATLEIWTCRVQFTYEVGDGITITFSPSSGRGCAVLREYSGVRALNSISDGTIFGQVGATSALVSMQPTAAGQLMFTAAAVETNAAITGDADVTDGAWSATTTTASNSGTANTSMSIAVQHKIVTGTSIQNWAATWAGAADYASSGIILDAAPAVTEEAPRGNPNYSCIAGFEGIGLASRSLPIDTGTAYQFDHTIFDSHIGTFDYTVTSEFASALEKTQHHVAYDLYPLGAETAVDEVVTVVLPVSAAVAGANTTIVGGGTALAALQSVGGTYIRFTASTAGTWPTPTADPTVEVRFDTTELENQPGRILRVGLRYVAWKADTADADPGEGFDVSWLDKVTPQSALHGSWLANDYRGDARMQTRWLGEVNAASLDMVVNTGTSPPTNYWRSNFTTDDLNQMTLNETAVLFRAQPGYLPTQLLVALDYVEMVVEVAPERRWATGYRMVSNLGLVPSAGFDYSRLMLLTSPTDQGLPVSLSLGTEWSLSVREALPPTPSDRYRADLFALTPKYTTLEAVGPSLQMKAVAQPRPSLEPEPIMWRVALNHGILAADAFYEFDQYLTSLVAFDQSSVGVDGPYILGYQAMAPFAVRTVFFGMTDPKLQYIKVAGGVTYDQIKIVAKAPAFTNATLTITVEQPLSTPIATATVTTNQILAGTPVGEGWYEISRPLSVNITPAAGQVVLRFTSDVSSEDPFQVSAVEPTGKQGYYGYNYDPSQGTLIFPDPEIWDYSAVLQCVMDPPDLAQITEAIPLLRPHSRCVAEELTIPIIELTNVDDFDHVLWERSIDGGNTWMVLALDPIQFFADYGVPWDVPDVRYRVTGYRDSDRRFSSSIISWNADPAVAPGAAFGLAYYGEAGNPLSGLSLAYVPVDETQLTITWSPLNPVTYVPLHGRDYQVALRPTEQRGLSVTVTVVVDYFALCDSADLSTVYAPEVPSRGGQSMSPTPFDELRAMASQPRIMLQLPGGHTRWVSMEIGSMTVRTASGLHVAEITLTDVTLPISDPYA